MAYQYALDAARLLERCRLELQEVIREAGHDFHQLQSIQNPDPDHRSSSRNKMRMRRMTTSTAALLSLDEALLQTEKLLLYFFLSILEQERAACVSSARIQELCAFSSTSTLAMNVDLLVSLLEVKRKEKAKAQDGRERDDASHHEGAIDKNNIKPCCYYPERSASDSLLFRLIVALELCLVKIDYSYVVVTGHRRNNSGNEASPYAISVAAACSLGVATYFRLTSSSRRGDVGPQGDSPLVLTLARMGLAFVAFSITQSAWSNILMSTKLGSSTKGIEEWNRQWIVVQSTTSSWNDLPNAAELSPAAFLQAKQTQKLIDYTLREPPTFTLWQSEGQLRFLLLKRAMDVFYASVGTAMDVTHKGQLTDSSSGQSELDWQLTFATAAASWFYSLIGASRKAAEVTSSSLSARALIQNAWGMVSLPAIKTLSLRASRLLKGAAVADRIEICGVPCFVLSADPAPELAATIKSLNRRHATRRTSFQTLSTIDEQSEHEETNHYRTSNPKPFAGAVSSRYRQRDVIFHLTGGGFFAHIIASDVPYLLDWSSATGAVVICPEYGLLPEHTFPDALNEVADVYGALVTGKAVSLLGFEVNRIILTGESAGGNLAAALVVKLGLGERAAESHSNGCHMNGHNNDIEGDLQHPPGQKIPFPDALMLSCPVLNLSLELSHSRVVGTNDPVLPSGLISAISDAYVPPRLGISKQHPLASPFFATNDMLSKFPPTLLIASSNDPLLDDSVAFNQRLRSLGIESELRAAENLPHAYLGLGITGFPEAVQVQQGCLVWLGYQLSRHREEDTT